MTRQFVACAFREGQTRTYTYHNDGEPVAPGDRVQIMSRDGLGKQTVFVVTLLDDAPSFPTKPILGKAPPPPPPPQENLL